MPLTFVKTYLRSPQSVGAIVPSTRQLACAMAAEIKGAQAIFEVGAGTGAVTAALQKLNLPLTAVEREPALAARLRSRFPDITVLERGLEHCEAELGSLPPDTTFISSLPFKSLPAPIAHHLAHLLTTAVRRFRTRRLVQFSYFPSPPFPAPPGLHWSCVRRVWRNVPPAFVWVLCAQHPAA